MTNKFTMNESKLQVTDAHSNSNGKRAGGEDRRAMWLVGYRNVALCLYVVFCAILAVIAYHRPLPTFDRYFYAGAVASLRYSDPVTIHRIARAEFEAQPAPFQFQSVAAQPYFADVYDSPHDFVEQLGFYRVKLGYVAAGYFLWRTGLPILTSLRLISACCFLAIGLTVLNWTHDPVLSSLLLLTPPVLNIGRVVTPDPLSTAVVVLALFSLARDRNTLATGLLLGSIFLRFDNIVLVFILLAWMVWRRRIRFSRGALLGGIAAVCAFLVNHMERYYGWRVLMQHSFIKPETEPITHPVLITFAGYFHALAQLRAIPYSFMTIWILVGAAVWSLSPKGSFFRDLLPLAGLCIVARLLMYPEIDDRYFVWAYLFAGVALVQTAQIPASNPCDSALHR
jgi:hypothetical protein